MTRRTEFSTSVLSRSIWCVCVALRRRAPRLTPTSLVISPQHDSIKIDGKTGKLGDTITIKRDGLLSSHPAPMPGATRSLSSNSHVRHDLVVCPAVEALHEIPDQEGT